MGRCAVSAWFVRYTVGNTAQTGGVKEYPRWIQFPPLRDS
jgi:hypothetical protein